jgi:hypothetical protein
LENWNDAVDGSGNSPASIAAMDNNAFVIQAGHTITFDVEDAVTCDGSISGWVTGIAGITITGATAGNTPGELTLSSVANSVDRIYGLRLTNCILGTNTAVYGKLTAGNAETPIPSNARTIIEMLDPSLANNDTIILGTYLIIELYGTGPIEPVYELTSAALATDTQLHVRGLRDHINPNTETEWKAGDTVIICNINKGYSAITKTLDSITPVDDGVINLSSTIGSTRLQGALVCLLNRNITIRSGSSPAALCYCIRNCYNAILDSILIYNYTSTVNNGSGLGYCYKGTIVQGTSIIYASGQCFYLGNEYLITGRAVLTGSIGRGIFVKDNSPFSVTGETVCCGSNSLISTVYSGMTSRFFEISGDVIIAGNSSFTGSTSVTGAIKGNVKIYGCIYGLNRIFVSKIINLKIYNCKYGIYDCSNLQLYGCEIGIDAVNGTADINLSGCISYNTEFGSSVNVINYQNVFIEYPEYSSVISWNHNNIESKYPSTWMSGGTIVPNLSYSPMPEGHTEICQMNFSQPSGLLADTYHRIWVDIPILVKAGDIINIYLWMLKNTNNMESTPQAMILTYDGDPWVITSIDSYTMVDNTNEQTNTLVYDASLKTVDTQVFLRVWGRHTSGTLYWAYNINKWEAGRMNGWIS